MTPRQVKEFFSRLQRETPAPKTELVYTSPFTLLVAVALSAQATDVGVNKATPGLFQAADTPQAMAALGEEGILPHIRSINFCRAKARNLAAMARLLVERHGGEVPSTREALTALPGVGRKTADVVLNVIFGQPTIAVDTHVFRVSNRTGLAPGKTPEEVSDRLSRVIPAAFLKDAHHWLILHGRYVCKARAPACGACPVQDLCGFAGKGGAVAPPKGKAQADKPRRQSVRARSGKGSRPTGKTPSRRTST